MIGDIPRPDKCNEMFCKTSRPGQWMLTGCRYVELVAELISPVSHAPCRATVEVSLLFEVPYPNKLGPAKLFGTIHARQQVVEFGRCTLSKVQSSCNQHAGRKNCLCGHVCFEKNTAVQPDNFANREPVAIGVPYLTSCVSGFPHNLDCGLRRRYILNQVSDTSSRLRTGFRSNALSASFSFRSLCV